MAASEPKTKRKALTFLQQKKAIEKSNAAFEKMSPAERRVAIAKDALSQIKKTKYLPTTGQYVIFSEDIVESGSFGDLTKEEKNTQLQSIFESMPECQVCARGALFLSTCRIFNDITVGDIAKIDDGRADGIHADSFDKYEHKFFTDKQISMIETTYERSSYNKGKVKLSDSEEYACIEYGNDSVNAEERLIAILQNIIKNKGDFVLPKKYLDETSGTYD